MAELKPCPFCGGRADTYCDGDCYCVRCFDTRCIANDIKPLYWEEDDAIEAWNRRAEDGK